MNPGVFREMNKNNRKNSSLYVYASACIYICLLICTFSETF